MKVHHLNCISTCPAGGRLMDGRSSWLATRGRLCCHCVLLELDSGGLALLDTGLGLQDVAHPRPRLSAFFLALVKPEWKAAMTARRQIEALGFSASDVRHIILTHLDFDHAGGLDDFPQATVHMMRAEADVAQRQGTWMDRQRFRPQQWSSRERWQVYDEAAGESWYGFKRARPLAGLPAEIAMIPLRGHTVGHAGIAVNRGASWMLLAGDAYFHANEMALDRPSCPIGLRLYQHMLDHDRAARLGNQHRLRELIRTKGGEVDVFSGHDTEEFQRLAGRPV
ncbi:MBL fold metallo-hydrolase [Achromobacter spanius]|uniref:MBL fold metallo-hydrolase n=1 Tax=Achromobacter spanius TaxID=217203 RepID=A0A2S5GQZ4_9BURK|nr:MULTISPECIES: MBL fold metallo-hydrolase [Achromobacter]MDX3986234.1 MBL fold metallo-hydrolase [Achromobacter sp.]PPA75358.1 MBL fold metallo-hydrolase [Achromobacter spanius]